MRCIVLVRIIINVPTNSNNFYLFISLSKRICWVCSRMFQIDFDKEHHSLKKMHIFICEYLYIELKCFLLPPTISNLNKTICKY